jgi:hypothetical protein
MLTAESQAREEAVDRLSQAIAWLGNVRATGTTLVELSAVYGQLLQAERVLLGGRAPKREE